MDTVTSTEPSEAFDGVQPPWASGLERGGGDTALGGLVTPRSAHQYSEGVIVPGRCCWCGKALFEHEGER
jgi:hypothetical protein